MKNESIKPRQRRHARTKAAILDAAMKIIAEKGTARLSMRGIAKRIDYSPAGLYEYYGSKDEIVTAVCEVAEQRLWKYMSRVDQSLDIDDYLIELGLAYVAFALQNRDHFLLLFTVLKNSAGGESTEIMQQQDSSYALLLRALQRGIEAGDYKTRPGYTLHEMGYNAWSLVHGMAMLRLTHLQEYDTDFETADRQSLITFVYGLKAAT
jgi:AcrR family transcriptional regulator